LNITTLRTTFKDGISLEFSNYNKILNNTLFSNFGNGIDVSSSNNTIIGNILKQNQVQAIDNGKDNVWNLTVANGGGNRWEDWLSPDADSNGFVDMPYNISGTAGARDFLPLVAPPNQVPIAQILTITPNPALVEEEILFQGSGSDIDGTIVAFNWTSSLDGFLMDLANFTISTLSVGITRFLLPFRMT